MIKLVADTSRPVPHRPALPPDTPPQFVDLCRRCWHPFPSARPSFEQISSDLELILHVARENASSGGIGGGGASTKSQALGQQESMRKDAESDARLALLNKARHHRAIAAQSPRHHRCATRTPHHFLPLTIDSPSLHCDTRSISIILYV